uniref:Ribosomal protein S18 acetylase RimI n=1 Tax=Candidatus Kentrum sp. MB TaxID=2138164 RepID=A0A450XKF4_9GAMM|nr:MAG: Ribosomal protein S18 acetylase RimI [Candidatus Kentron sp. MB]VFK29810.1 MAG: Ribosomal protein S18 acetylase RimI [Candidatus Kentron sp. MB]VFK74953.1 MAG: Ribosomal protein S18 acetylase RimI [Candidatus Kentron sp. MB]
MDKFKITPLSEKYLDDVMKLQHIVLNSLADRSFFYADTKEYMADLIKTDIVLGCFTEDNLVAYRGIKFVIDKDENLGKDINLPESELPNVAHFDTIVVHPSYRENGFGYSLNTEALDVIRGRGRHHILVTVSPRNIASVNMFLKFGMKIKKFSLKYGGLERYIMHMDIRVKE